MTTFFRIVDSLVIPLVLVLTWVILVLTADIRGLPLIVTLLAFGMVMLLWATYRELRTHAAASRMAANGEPDQLLALADRELARRLWPRGKVPFHLYRSMAYALAGDGDEARRALDATHLDLLGSRARRQWGILHAAQRIALLGEAGDAAAARRALDDDLRPMLRFVPGAGAAVIAREAEARVLFAEGQLDDARPLFEQLAKDVRLGPAPRAIARHFAARCVAASDPDAARGMFEEAARLAPKTWVGKEPS
jgi:tetratricopeptide (TPR) repeat protein